MIEVYDLDSELYVTEKPTWSRSTTPNRRQECKRKCKKPDRRRPIRAESDKARESARNKDDVEKY